MIGPTVWEMDPTFKHWEMQPASRPLVMLNAVPAAQQAALVRDVVKREGWAILYSAIPSAEVYQLLQDSGTSWKLAYNGKPSVYKKGWWKDGNKHLCKGEDLIVWQPDDPFPWNTYHVFGSDEGP